MLIPFRLNHCDLESSAWPNHEKCETLVHLLSFVTKNILSFQWLNSTNCKLLFRVWQCFVIVTELVCCKLLFLNFSFATMIQQVPCVLYRSFSENTHWCAVLTNVDVFCWFDLGDFNLAIWWWHGRFRFVSFPGYWKIRGR